MYTYMTRLFSVISKFENVSILRINYNQAYTLVRTKMKTTHRNPSVPSTFLDIKRIAALVVLV